MTQARIHERGYRRYEGPRRGVGAAIVSTVRHTLRFVLGLRRRARSKIIPWGIAVLSYLPALGFVAAFAFLPDQVRELARDFLPGPEAYLGGISLLIYLAGALAGPAALCGDRRSGAIALYLASPLDVSTYLVAKATAVGVVLSLVTVVPPLIYVVGLVVADVGPDGPLAVGLALGRVGAAGLAVAAPLGALSMAAGAVTDRQATASVVVVLALLISAAVVGTVVFALDAPRGLLLLDVSQVSIQSVALAYGESTEIPAPLVLSALVGWVLGPGAFTVARYGRMAVTR